VALRSWGATNWLAMLILKTPITTVARPVEQVSQNLSIRAKSSTFKLTFEFASLETRQLKRYFPKASASTNFANVASVRSQKQWAAYESGPLISSHQVV
jgi:hypothetical protein